jgi:hypothetical protein
MDPYDRAGHNYALEEFLDNAGEFIVAGAEHTAPDAHVSGFKQGFPFLLSLINFKKNRRKGDDIIYMYLGKNGNSYSESV